MLASVLSLVESNSVTRCSGSLGGRKSQTCLIIFYFSLPTQSAQWSYIVPGLQSSQVGGSSLTAQKTWVQSYLWWTHSEEPSYCSVGNWHWCFQRTGLLKDSCMSHQKPEPFRFLHPLEACWRHLPRKKHTWSENGICWAGAGKVWLLWAPLGLEVLPVVTTNCPGLFRDSPASTETQASWDSWVPCCQINAPLWDTTELDNCKVR